MALTKSDEHVLTEGHMAPHFCLENVDGEIVSSEQFEGKILVVIFMCNHCPFVKPKMQEIADIQNDFKDKDVVVICINSNDIENYPEDSPENMKKVARQFGYEYYLFDETQEVAKDYGAVCTPDPFIFDKDHKLVYHGRINDAMRPKDSPKKHDMKEVLKRIVDGKKVKEWFLPSMGCNIKWKANEV